MEDVRLTLVILMMSGHVPLPRRRMYWEMSDDVRNVAISEAMSLSRFQAILRYWHVCNNDQLDTRFMLHFSGQENMDVDESMIPYYGRHSAKQFI